MRVNLNCPFSEKDEAKALGARWDAARKVWYIENVEDLTPFMRWVSDGPAPIKRATRLTQSEELEQEETLRQMFVAHLRKKKKAKTHKPPKDHHATVTTGGNFVPMCNCDALPWEDCEHTDALAMQAMSDQLTSAPYPR